MLDEYFQLALNRIHVSFGSSIRRPVHIKRQGRIFEIHVDKKIIYAPGMRRWRMYRNGIDMRLERVARRYGLHDLSPTERDEWVIDIGAYMGEWTLYMLRKGFNVLSIEPDPLAARCFERNMNLHAPADSKWLLDERVCFHEKRGSVTFYSEPVNADGSIFPSVKHASVPLTREAARLDTIIGDRIGEKRICALKMDAEGAEPELLMGAQNLLAGELQIGIDAGAERLGESTVEECKNILINAGFRLIENPSGDIVMAVSDREKEISS
ncbi:MAG: FkbM family methyltransferase [Rhodospirillaceae bacterium]|nr:FkbM family methyltransferase [Rhodospirillaceae bacterium]